MDLDGRTVLVTGGNGSLGSAICEVFARAGCNVVIGYSRDDARTDEVARVVRSLGRRPYLAKFDLTNEKEIDANVDRVFREAGRIDFLVNNAASQRNSSKGSFQELQSVTTEDWDKMFALNVRSLFQVTRAVARNMRALSTTGHIVNVASTVGLYPGGSSLCYAITKAAVIHLTRCLAVALGPDISVNCVAPGWIEGTRIQEGADPERRKRTLSMTALKRFPNTKTVADQILAVCRAEGVSGQVLVVDGGLVFH